MRRPAILVAAGIAAFLAFLIAFLPASILLRFLPPEVTLSEVTGTVWSGAAESLAIRGKPVGAVRWSSHAWRLALLELNYALDYLPEGGEVRMNVSLGRGGRLDISTVRGSFPLLAIDGLVAPAGWKGTAELDIDRIELDAGFPRMASGTITVNDLTAAGPRGVNIGDFELTLGEGAVGSDSIAGRLRDLDQGPMRVRATLELRPDRSYLLSGEVAAGPEAGEVVQRTLAFLGPPDSLGRRPFTVEGTI